MKQYDYVTPNNNFPLSRRTLQLFYTLITKEKAGLLQAV